MARSYNVVEVNKFNAGLITDASPLTTPDNSSLDEDNFVLNIDGSRNRRLGIDYEDGFVKNTSSVTYTNAFDIGIRTFKWDNAGGNPDISIQVVQIGNTLDFYRMTSGAISASLFDTVNFPSVGLDARFSFASVDGFLVVVNGDKEIYIFNYTDPNILIQTTQRILIRDFFGVDDIILDVDYTRGNQVQDRISPSVSTKNHIYNLRNQSFGIPRIWNNNESLTDPIVAFETVSGVLPSNSDSVTQVLFPDASDSDDRISDRFWASDLFKNPLGNSRAPMGYFIIDAIDRGVSRAEETIKNNARYPQLSYASTPLPTDRSPSGATAIAEFAGRVFYAGFSGDVIDGDGHSPKLSSYVMFSKVVESIADITACYQVGDPTSKDFPDILATDGGFIRLNGAYGIHKLVSLNSSLFVVATNGVWRIVGGSDNGFLATSYIVEKVSDKGCTSPDSITVVDNGIMFWSDDAIYYISTDQFGSWVSNNISFGKIQGFYDSIEIGDKQTSHGMFDTYERKVRWVFRNSSNSTQEVRELVLDLQLQAYYPNTIKQLGSNLWPRVVSMYRGFPYQIDSNENDVVVGGDPVIVDGEAVVISFDNRLGVSQKELGYVVITSTTGGIEYTFAKYNNTDFRDWYSEDNVGEDADAFLITNYMSGTDFQRDKQLPYITVHLRRTETGYNTDMTPINPSSCLMQARWDWSNTDRSGKWGREFQAYRYRRAHLPIDSDDDYDNGFSTIVSRNKLRGNGKVLSLKFRTEPYKNLHLYGWSMIFSVAENV